MKRAITATAVAVCAALLFTGCTAGSSTSRAPAAPPVVGQADKVTEAGGSALTTQQDAATAQKRDVVTTGSMAITAEDPLGAARQAAQIVQVASGRVDSRSETPRSEKQAASAYLDLRIPSDRLDAVVTQLDELGTVTAFSTTAADVTQQKQDLDARIAALQTSVDRLRQLMAQSASTADLIEVENALAQRQGDLDAMTSQRDYLADQIDYSTLSVQFTTTGVALPGTPTTFWDGLVAGWNALIAFLGAVLVVGGAVLPWIVLAGILALIVLGVIALVRRSRRQSAA